jgi:hypothetical protein
MGPRTRKAVGSVAVLAFLCFWVWLALELAILVPDLWWAQLLYFAVAGACWGVPLLPLFAWMQKKG